MRPADAAVLRHMRRRAARDRPPFDRYRPYSLVCGLNEHDRCRRRRRADTAISGNAKTGRGSLEMSSRKVLRPHARCQALIDFDGTIAPDDPTDRLLERFAEPAWREVEEAWQSGRISSRECMQRQVELLRATPEEIDAAIADVRIDPGFPEFLRYCWSRGVAAMVVSDGFDRVVRAVLAAAGLPIPFFANKLEWQGADRWRLAFPHAQPKCLVGSANCKCSHGIGPTSRKIVAIGDGRSDFCMSTRADLVIAKGTLAGYCGSRGLPHRTFTDFHEAKDHLAAWLQWDDDVAAAALTTSG
jgi:2,3-diketo-5-methylthio-1-phosphopentane phosphatase